MRRPLPLLLVMGLCVSLSACATPKTHEAVRPAPAEYVMVVTKLDGKNVFSFQSGEPDAAVRKIVQQFLDDTLELEEGERRTVRMSGPKK